MRLKSSVYNFTIRLTTGIVSGLLGISVNNLLIVSFGSDINGVTATINQVLGILAIFEGGFTLATIVALYQPYLDHKIDQINNILSATKAIFVRVGCLIALFSTIISLLAPLIINSNVDKHIIVALFFISSASLSVNFIFSAKYEIMYSVAQKEYFLNFINFLFQMISYIVVFIFIKYGLSILLIKFAALFIPLLKIPLILNHYKKIFPGVNFKSNERDYSVVSNSKHVMTQKIASLVFGSTDIVLISIMLNSLWASVYYVYNMIFMFLKSILFALILAPFNAFGQLFIENDNEKVLKYFRIYQYITIVISSIFLSTLYLLIFPFVSLYTRQVTDINYLIKSLPTLFTLSVGFELMSNTFGVLSNSSGDFVGMKKIALIGAALNITTSIILIFKYGMPGVLIGTIISYFIMLIFQIYLVHFKILRGGFKSFVRIILQNILISLLSIKFILLINFKYNSYTSFAINGLATFIIVSIMFIAGNSLFNKKITCELLNLLKIPIKKQDKYPL